jgi:hypothetical protein
MRRGVSAPVSQDEDAFLQALPEEGLFRLVVVLYACAVLLLILRNLWPLVLGHAATNFIEYLPFLGLEEPEPGQP